VLAGTLAMGLALAVTTLPLVDHWQDRGTGIAGIDEH
jgi:hypothetical protein